MVNINEAYAAAWGSVDARMCGIKDSGLGRRHGIDGLLDTTWSQTVATQRLWPVGEHRTMRGRRFQAGMTTALRALKRARRT
jgi:succinate-semialdehyde dehydrogenase/glutarate-semialdehyde dehydrogenase